MKMYLVLITGILFNYSMKEMTFAETITSNQNIIDLSMLQSSISVTSCEFYKQLDQFIPCGSQGYVKKFIYEYCLAYLNEQHKFTDQKWLTTVRVCLQETMFNHLKTNPNATCSQIKAWGFGSHSTCYIQPDLNQPEVTFCKLPFRDMTRVIWIARGSALEPAVWSELVEIIHRCNKNT